MNEGYPYGTYRRTNSTDRKFNKELQKLMQINDKEGTLEQRFRDIVFHSYFVIEKVDQLLEHFGPDMSEEYPYVLIILKALKKQMQQRIVKETRMLETKRK